MREALLLTGQRGIQTAPLRPLMLCDGCRETELQLLRGYMAARAGTGSLLTTDQRAALATGGTDSGSPTGGAPEPDHSAGVLELPRQARPPAAGSPGGREPLP